MLWRQAGYYGAPPVHRHLRPERRVRAAAAALGMPAVKLQPGGRDRLNPLDPGPGDRETSVLARQTLLIGMIGVALGRDLNVVEEAILAIAVDPPRRARTGPPAQRRWSTSPRCSASCPPSCALTHTSALLTEAELNASLTALRLALVRAARADPARHVRRPVDVSSRLDLGARDRRSTCPPCSTTPKRCRWCS